MCIHGVLGSGFGVWDLELKAQDSGLGGLRSSILAS